MALTLTARAGSNNNTDLSSYATASFTPAGSALLIAFVGAVKTATPIVRPTLSSSHSLAAGWVEVAANDWKLVGNAITLVCWACITNASPGASTVTIDFAGTTVLGCEWSIVDVAGGPITSIGPAGGAAIVQAPTNNGAGANATSGSVTLAAAADSGNRPISAWGRNINEASNPRASWTEIHDLVLAAPSRALESQWRSDAFETTASASWTTTSQWGGVALELNSVVAADASAPSARRPQMGAYLSGL